MRDYMDRRVPNLSGLPHLPVPHLHANRSFVSISPDFRDWQKIERIDSREKRLREGLGLKGALSRQSSSFCLILPITRPQSLWNLK